MSNVNVLLKQKSSLTMNVDDREYVLNLPDNAHVGEIFDILMIMASQVKVLMEERLAKMKKEKLKDSVIELEVEEIKKEEKQKE